jgi:hypothetical protein
MYLERETDILLFGLFNYQRISITERIDHVKLLFFSMYTKLYDLRAEE